MSQKKTASQKKVKTPRVKETLPPRGPHQIPVACFAPPLTDKLLAEYKDLIETIEDPEVQDEVRKLCDCCEKWWNLPESKETGPTLRVTHQGEESECSVSPLSDDLIGELWEVTPYMRELNTLSTPKDEGLFDKLPPGDIRNMAFHLLWYCKEITLDREPMTGDKLKPVRMKKDG
jgi:hypothetical protein